MNSQNLNNTYKQKNILSALNLKETSNYVTSVFQNKNISENYENSLDRINGIYDIDLSNEMSYQQSNQMKNTSKMFQLEEIQNNKDQAQLGNKTNSFCQTINYRRIIVKTKRNQSKFFKRKKYELLYSNSLEENLLTINQFLIFGYIQIETDYLDFIEPSMKMKSQLCEKVLQINHVKNNKIDKRLELFFNPIGKSGLIDVSELLTVLQQKQNKEYKLLAQQMLCYQIKLTRQISHMKQLKAKLIKKQIEEDDLIQAFDNSYSYFINYFNKKHQSQYTHTLFFRSNVTYRDCEIYESHFSYSFLELLGIDPQNFNNILSFSFPYQVQSGRNRLRNTVTLLKVINSKLNVHKDLPFHIQTIEGIQIDCSIDVKIVKYHKKKSWMNSYDNFMIVLTFNIDQDLQQSVQKQRNQILEENEEDFKESNLIYRGIVEQAQLDIFLEKYYPNSLHDRI